MSNLTVFVSGISPDAHSDDVINLFSFCGKLKHATFAPNEAVLQFETQAAFETALLMDQAILKNTPISVTPFENTREMAALLPAAPSPQVASSPAPPPRVREPGSLSSNSFPVPPPSTARYNDPKLIFVSNLSNSVDESLLNRFFSFCGAVQAIGMDSLNGFALIEFRLAKSLLVAKAMQGSILGGEPINVEPFSASKHGTALYNTIYAQQAAAKLTSNPGGSQPPPLPPRSSPRSAVTSSSIPS